MTAPVVAAVVPAAGLGQRLGADGPKAMHLLGGEPMLVHSVRTLAAGPVDLVVVATPPGLGAAVLELLAGAHPGAELSVVDGGATRSDSVRLALAALPPSVRVVLVHDAARPLVPAALVAAVVAAVEGGADAVVPGLPVTDTVKQVDGADVVVATVDRSALRAVQTPQGFRREVLDAAYAGPESGSATDDAGHVERAGGVVVVVPGAEEAFKVTRPLDLVLAEAVLAGRRQAGG
jgi:2-C-methyl-D-erythritol 4-phosphate cytidylyltransferase